MDARAICCSSELSASSNVPGLDGRQSASPTPEFASFKRFIAQHRSDPLGAFPADAVHIRRVPTLPESEAKFLGGPDPDEEGRALIISDALASWPALQKWTPAYLAKRFGDDEVFANDRAPARSSDAQEGRPQVTVRLTLRDYITYYDAACGSGGGGGAAAADALVGAPFYLNGWAALASHPEEVGADCPPPYFSELLDHSDLILEQLDKQFFSKKPTTAAAPAIPAAAAASSSAWWKRLSVGLSKLFLGPAGTVTRLHYDAGDAHGWLGQIWGRKLFVLYPPSATASLYPLNSDTQNKAVTVQSPVDPLSVDAQLYPLAAALAPHVAVLEPGEAIIIPRGWWHYAVALEPSLTAMRNFYHAESNAAAMVQFVMAKVKIVFASRNRVSTALAALQEAMTGVPCGGEGAGGGGRGAGAPPSQQQQHHRRSERAAPDCLIFEEEAGQPKYAPPQRRRRDDDDNEDQDSNNSN